MKGPTTDLLRAMPKADIHRHLEGAIRLSTFKVWARGNPDRLMEVGFRLPDDDLSIENLVAFPPPGREGTDEKPTLEEFLKKFLPLRCMFDSLETVKRLTLEALQDATREGCVYTELRFSPNFITSFRNLPLRETVLTVIETIEDWNRSLGPLDAWEKAIAEGEFPGTIGEPLLLISRHVPISVSTGILESVSDLLGKSLRGIDLAGDEAGYPPELFKGLFRDLSSVKGLFTTVHAGEIPVPENVVTAVEALGASRIGHGVWSWMSGYAMDLLRERGTVLEVCPTSNLHTGVVGKLSEHPLRKLAGAGVLVTVNSDDPAISRTDMNGEWNAVTREMGLGLEFLAQCTRTAISAGFAPSELRAAASRAAIARTEALSRGL